jgi:SOS-response transcriptional repressor LexA
VFYARLEQLCRENNTSVAEVAETVLHVSSGTPTGWKKGASPRASLVAIAARHFNVSADYLLGLTSERRGEVGARSLDPDEAHLVDALRAAPEASRRAAMNLALSALGSAPAAESALPDATPAPGRVRPFPARPGRKSNRAWKGVEGRAAAGPPITAVPEDERRILVPVKYTGEQYFIVQADGDSMLGVVNDGDYCVFNKRGSFDNGRIALVQVDGPTDQPDATIKRVYRRPGGKVELRSENPKYPPMLYLAEEVVLMGELVAVLPQNAEQA